MSRSVGEQMRSAWSRLSGWPGGRWLFSRGLGFMAPYTGSIRAVVLELEPGRAVVGLRERRAVRNHLRSVHAVALMNLAEMATGLALNVGLPSDGRAILTGLSIEFLKKARGRLVATCECGVPETSERHELEIEGEICDQAGDVVARAHARWLVGPRDE